MQEVYTIVAKRSIKVPEKVKTEENGELKEVTKLRKKQEKTNIVFVKPSPAMMEKAEFFFGLQYNKLIQAGYMTRAMMAKKFNDVGGLGAENDEELKEQLALYMDATQKIEFYGGAKKLSEQQKELLEEAKKNLALSTKFIEEYQINLNSVYGQTAEAKADQKMVEWFMLNFLFIKETIDEEEEYFPFFEGADYEAKRDFYLRLQDEVKNPTEDFLKKQELLEMHFEDFIRVISIWRSGLASTQKEIDEKMNELFPNE